MKTNQVITVCKLAAALLLLGCGAQSETDVSSGKTELSAEEAKAIAKEAYIYGFPIVMTYKAMFNYVVDRDSPEYKGPFNQLGCEARLFTPEDKAVVTPNADTPYCMFWMDARSEPMVLTVPEMEPARFYHFQLIDLYTHNFAYAGTLTTGNGAGKYLIAGPDWDGEKPAGITDVIRSETGFIFNVTRTQLFGPDDLAKVKEIQGSYGLQPLSAFLGMEAPPAKPMPKFPQERHLPQDHGGEGPRGGHAIRYPRHPATSIHRAGWGGRRTGPGRDLRRCHAQPPRGAGNQIGGRTSSEEEADAQNDNVPGCGSRSVLQGTDLERSFEDHATQLDLQAGRNE